MKTKKSLALALAILFTLCAPLFGATTFLAQQPTTNTIGPNDVIIVGSGQWTRTMTRTALSNLFATTLGFAPTGYLALIQSNRDTNAAIATSLTNFPRTQVISFNRTNGLANGLPITAADGTFLIFQGAASSTTATNDSIIAGGVWKVDARTGGNAVYASITSSIPVRVISATYSRTNVNPLGNQYPNLTVLFSMNSPGSMGLGISLSETLHMSEVTEGWRVDSFSNGVFTALGVVPWKFANPMSIGDNKTRRFDAFLRPEQNAIDIYTEDAAGTITNARLARLLNTGTNPVYVTWEQAGNLASTNLATMLMVSEIGIGNQAAAQQIQNRSTFGVFAKTTEPVHFVSTLKTGGDIASTGTLYSIGPLAGYEQPARTSGNTFKIVNDLNVTKFNNGFTDFVRFGTGGEQTNNGGFDAPAVAIAGSDVATNLAARAPYAATTAGSNAIAKLNGFGTNLTVTSLPGSTTAALTLSNATGSAARLTEWRHTNGALMAWQGSNGNHFLVGNYTDDANFGGLQLSATGGVNRLWSQTRGTGTNAPIDFSAHSGVLSQLRLSTNGNVGIGTNAPEGTLAVNGNVFARGFSFFTGSNNNQGVWGEYAGLIGQSSTDGFRVRDAFTLTDIQNDGGAWFKAANSAAAGTPFRLVFGGGSRLAAYSSLSPSNLPSLLARTGAVPSISFVSANDGPLNIGIGITNPLARLHLTNSTASSVAFRVDNTGTNSVSEFYVGTNRVLLFTTNATLSLGQSGQGFGSSTGSKLILNGWTPFFVELDTASQGNVSVGIGSQSMFYTGLNGSSASGGLVIPSGGLLGWSAVAAGNNVADTILARDASGVLAQRNGNNAQTNRVYGRYQSATTNSQWLELGYDDTTSNLFVRAGSAGTNTPNLTFGSSNGVAMTITPSGNVGIGTNNNTADLLNVRGTIAARGYALLVGGDNNQGVWSEYSGLIGGSTSDGFRMRDNFLITGLGSDSSVWLKAANSGSAATPFRLVFGGGSISSSWNSALASNYPSILAATGAVPSISFVSASNGPINVGIGTATPTNTLQVAGISMAMAGFASYSSNLQAVVLEVLPASPSLWTNRTSKNVEIGWRGAAVTGVSVNGSEWMTSLTGGGKMLQPGEYIGFTNTIIPLFTWKPF